MLDQRDITNVIVFMRRKSINVCNINTDNLTTRRIFEETKEKDILFLQVRLAL